MPTEEHYRKLERMYASAPINGLFRPTLHIEEGIARVTMPVQPQHLHAAKALHGAVYFKMMDDAAFFAANSLVDDVFVVTATFNVYFTRPVFEGELQAVGRVVHASRRLYLAEAEVTDADGRQVGRGSGSFMPTSTPLSPEIGYA